MVLPKTGSALDETSPTRRLCVSLFDSWISRCGFWVPVITSRFSPLFNGGLGFYVRHHYPVVVGVSGTLTVGTPSSTPLHYSVSGRWIPSSGV